MSKFKTPTLRPRDLNQSTTHENEYSLVVLVQFLIDIHDKSL